MRGRGNAPDRRGAATEARLLPEPRCAHGFGEQTSSVCMARDNDSVRSATVLAITLVAVALIGHFARAATPVPRAEAAPTRILCGVERWSVKTFSDADRWRVDLTRRYRTVAQLNKLVRPAKRPQNGRVAAELLTYRVTATVSEAARGDAVGYPLVGAERKWSRRSARASRRRLSAGTRRSRTLRSRPQALPVTPERGSTTSSAAITSRSICSDRMRTRFAVSRMFPPLSKLGRLSQGSRGHRRAR